MTIDSEKARKEEKKEKEYVNMFKIIKKDILLLPLKYYGNLAQESLLYTAILYLDKDFYKEEPYIIPVRNLQDAYFINKVGTKIRIKNTAKYIKEGLSE